VLFVSHNMGAIRSLCRTGLVLNKGTVAYNGDVGAAVEHYYRLVGALREKPEEATPGRAGFGPVTINEGAVPVKHSDGFVASTTLRVPESATGYTLHCTVNDMHGRRLFTHVHFEGMAEPGIYSVRASCPPLFLATGLYSLHFKALFQGSYGSARALSDHVPLDVVGAESRFESVLVPPVDITIARSAAHG
jgi:lipopolysaccharide transport system ATP-binding protein